MSHPNLNSIIADWPKWGLKSQPKLIKHFTAGLNHHTCLVESDSQHYVIKQFAQPHRQAIESQRWATTLGLTPPILFADATYKYCVMAALKSNTLDPRLVDESALSALASGLNTLHNATAPKMTEFDLFWFCEQYLELADNKAREVHRRLTPILKLFTNDPTPWVFCHNDLVAANCFINDQRAQFIDWEYAQIHNPWFDLAAIIYYLKLDTAQSKQFLESYQIGLSSAMQQDIFYAAQCALLWGDMLWHLAYEKASNWNTFKEKYADLQRLTQYFKIVI